MRPGQPVLDWIRHRQPGGELRRDLLLVIARAEEALVDTHVANTLDLLDALQEEAALERGIKLYAQMMDLDERTATVVADRVRERLDSSLEREARFRRVFDPARN